jgi:hypothetical protein
MGITPVGLLTSTSPILFAKRPSSILNEDLTERSLFLIEKKQLNGFAERMKVLRMRQPLPQRGQFQEFIKSQS